MMNQHSPGSTNRTLQNYARASCCCLALVMSACADSPAHRVAGARFFSAWAAPQGMLAEQAPELRNSTIRMILRPTIDGQSARIKLENTVAATPVSFAAAYLGVLDRGAELVPGTNKALSFAGQSTVMLAPGAGVYSDAIDFPVRAFQRLALSLDVESAAEISTHALGLTTGYYAPGRNAHSTSGVGFTPLPALAQGADSFPVYWVAALDIASTATSGTIVALGDSVTDGRCSTTVDGKVLPDRYQRWTDVLAERLARLPAHYPKAVVNAGIAGNQVLNAAPTGPSALARLERDVLERAGVTHVILFEGTNDLSRGATFPELRAGVQEIIERVHARGVKIIGATALPRGKPDSAPGRHFTAVHERHRLEFNAWVRDEADFDGVIDFDAVLTGGGVAPTGAQMMKPEFSCDYVHPNAAGYRALGEAIDLRLFE